MCLVSLSVNCYLQVKIAKRPLDSYVRLDFAVGEMPVGAENIGRGARWIKAES
jgi:hypothetical protein